MLFDEEQWYAAWNGVVAFEPQTGENNWVLKDERSLLPVAIGEDTLYVGGDIPNGGTNELAAVDPATGSIRWQTDVGTWKSNIASVILTENTLVTGSTDGESPIAESGDGFMPAKGIDATTGEVRWTYRPETRSVYPRATVGDLVLLETRENETTPNEKRAIVAVDPTSGERRWRRSGTRLEFHDVTTEGDGDGLVYLSIDSEKVLVLDAADGREKWQYEVQADGVSHHRFRDMKFDSGTLFVTHGRNRLTAFDATSGVERWSYRTPDKLTRHWTVDSDTVYLTTENAIHALERD